MQGATTPGGNAERKWVLLENRSGVQDAILANLTVASNDELRSLDDAARLYFR